MTSYMLLELLGQRHRGSAGNYQASIGFSRATFGWQRRRQSEPACWQSAFLVLSSNADAEEAGSGCSGGSDHSGWRLLPKHAAARHSDRASWLRVHAIATLRRGASLQSGSMQLQMWAHMRCLRYNSLKPIQTIQTGYKPPYKLP